MRAIRLDAFGSYGATINYPIDPTLDQSELAVLRSGGPAHVLIASLEPGGALQISGDDGQPLILSAGKAMLLAPGEQHESVTTTAATLAIMDYVDSAH